MEPPPLFQQLTGLRPGALGVGISFGEALTGPLILKDLWWPSNLQRALDSRGTMTHEYGHFLMCDMLFEIAGRTDPIEATQALTRLVPRVLEFDNDSADDEIALVTESWADTFAMQVVGGSNYITPQNATPSEDPSTRPPYADNSMGYCRSSPCMEWNYQGESDYVATGDKHEFYDELAKIQSTVHDAFDRNDGLNRLELQPSNGDLWVDGNPPVSPPLRPFLVGGSASYIQISDELVSLNGTGWQDWVTHWLGRGGQPTREDYFGGLSDALKDQNFDWCDRCEAFAIHERTLLGRDGEPNAYVPTSFRDHWDRWQVCHDPAHQTEPIETWLGEPPPEPFLNVNAACQACPPLQHPDMSGTCVACPPNEVPRGILCQPCAPGQVANPSTNTCVGCGPYEITGTNNNCVPCPQGQVADRATNTCVACPADLVVDLATWTGCEDRVYTTSILPAANDTCPDDYWIEVRNLTSAVARGCAGGVSVSTSIADVASAECAAHTATLDVFDSAFAPRYAQTAPGQLFGIVGAESCRWPTVAVFSPPTITGGLPTIRVRAKGAHQTPFGVQQLPAVVGIQQNDDPVL